jgi:hypothetical protein
MSEIDPNSAADANQDIDKPKSPGNYIDVFVKRMFSRFVVFVDFLLFYADRNFVNVIDLSKIELAPTHYIGKDADERIVDLVFQCPLKDGQNNLMAVIIFEHQSESLKEIPLKLQKYISALWDAEKKAGKPLSAPYFIVLRTAKNPHRGLLPKMVDLLPKDRDGKPLGKLVEIEYDVVDLPAWNFDRLVGGPVLRAVLGILKKMIEGHADELPEAMLPLCEISDEEQKFELTKELLDFAAKAMAAHNRRLDEAILSQTLKPIFKDKEQEMIKTIFDEKYDAGVAVGIEKGIEKGIETLQRILTKRLGDVPSAVRDKLHTIHDLDALGQLTDVALDCQSLAEFEQALNK